MEVLMIIIGVLAIIGMIAFLVNLFIKAYNKDQQEQDERTLVLEKRLYDFKKERIDEEDNIKENLDTCMDLIMNLASRIQKLERKKKSDKNEL